ncbi:Protein of unknown function (DUF732) [Mycolicibacterium rhodesiae NBB3]|uniref:DUF732 domain-containing protein n=1 Tax=Mycolicibacterium rhodesiae (strain NBB3) TaxID=710685 RepID=G8RIB1_MYCRN|nr:DUF732 domain-containing protein [Mycolicibacterium rhodesiae]AEV74626.1 Protein of unknown function (DUF732) [Mycolicibacterium rhodesiae NBB3]
MIKPKRTLTATLVGVAAALSLAVPASAEPVDTTFLNALNDAGIGYGDPVSTEKLGQSVCPMLVDPGKNLASVYSTVSNNGINPDVAAFFTGIAISAYCPSMTTQIGNGTILEGLSGLGGLNGLNGLTGLGIPGF